MPQFNLADYETVEDRLARFWQEHPDGRVTTELVRYEAGEWVFRAEVYRDQDGPVWASGYAHEVHGQGMVNKTSAAENCETSAIGRALANAGYATKGKRPSREEMSKASAPPPTQSKPAASGARGTGGTTAGGSVTKAATPAAELSCPECGGPAEYRGSSKTLFYCPAGHGGKL